MSRQALHGDILTPEGWLRGSLQFEAGRIAAITGTPLDESSVRAVPDKPLILPGFIDLHVHGGAGADVMDAGDATTRMARLHARHGTTALLATTMTAPLADIEAALRALAPLIQQRAPGVARVLGVHLEGPYIQPQRLGAQPPFARLPALDEILALHALAPIRVLTLAPEVDGALALIPALVQAGMRVQIGHSNATYEQACEALAAGAAGFTHLFNAMGRLQHRAPGVAGAALARGQFAEVIPDLLHVHPGALQLGLRAIPGLYAVTDATSATGMPDGEYRLGRHTVTRCRDAVRLRDGTLAGSVLTMDQALRNLVSLGLSVSQASARLSAWPARYLQEAERGELRLGAWADLVLLDPQTLELTGVFLEGEPLDRSPA